MRLLDDEPDEDHLVLTIDGAIAWVVLDDGDEERGESLEILAARTLEHYGDRATVEVVLDGGDVRKRMLAICNTESGDVVVSQDEFDEEGVTAFLRETIRMRMNGEITREREMLVEGLPYFSSWDNLEKLYAETEA